MHQMSTDSTHPTDPTPVAPTTEPAGADAPVPAEEPEPGWVTRHTALLTTVLVAVIVAAVAIAGVVFYRDRIDERNADTESAFADTVSAQGATVETVECDGDTCAAVIGGQAYTVLVQEDEQGEQHFGVSAYAGD
jgi:hypothetical protein